MSLYSYGVTPSTPNPTRTAREALGWTRRELAYRAGVSAQTIRNAEYSCSQRATTTRRIRAALERPECTEAWAVFAAFHNALVSGGLVAHDTVWLARGNTTLWEALASAAGYTGECNMHWQRVPDTYAEWEASR